MTGISRRNLFSKLNAPCYAAIESATAFCKLRGNAYVELVHWLHQLNEVADSDFGRILRSFVVDPGILARDLTRALDKLPRGATAVSDLSQHIEDATQEAWLVATLAFGDDRIRSGHLLYGCLSSRPLSHALLAISPEFGKLTLDRLRDGFEAITRGSPEATAAQAPVETAGEASPAAPGGRGGALARYTVDLTASARAGKLDPVIGRDPEIRQIIDVLMRRRQNNPILTGEAGVGKTAIVEGLALRIVAGEVPAPLRDVALHALDLGLLQAGAGVKGEFEQRLRDVIAEVQAAPHPVIMFIDEAHTLIGAGGQEGTGDAANMLKPALARGTLRTIGATTWAEYKRYIEKDPALSRRFQAIPVAEPDEPQAVTMMRRMVQALEKHHGVEILDEAVAAAVALSRRYIPARQLPDKSLSLLDTACARVAVSRHARPDRLEHERQRIDALTLELEMLGREEADGGDVGERRAEVEEALEEARQEAARLDVRWQAERSLVEEIQRARAALRADGDAADPAELRRLDGEWREIQEEAPLVLDRVDRNAVAAVVQDWTGIPVGRLLKDEATTLLSLAEALGRRVVGQDHAMEAIAQRVQTSRAGLDDPAKPIGVFLLCGPSGVGKTETALALAETLLGGESNLITINMSEFQEAHTVSSLKGAPPGYVGYGQGGVLTEAVRRRPHAVILLDEIEKAHPDVHEIFFQVFDKGVMEDGEGRKIDFRNTLILLTSNVGGEQIARLCAAEARPEPEVLESALHRPLREVFPPALLGRMTLVPYYALSDGMLDRIVRLRLERIADRMMQAHKVPLTCDDAVAELIARRARQVDSGGRMVDAILTSTLLPAISRHILAEQRDGRQVGALHIGVRDDAFHYQFDGGLPAASLQPSD